MRTAIRNRRNELKISQAEVARRANMNRATYSHIEIGRRRPNIEQALAISNALGIPPDLKNFINDCGETQHENHGNKTAS